MKYYTIQDLAVMTGFTSRTLRNYIKLGLLDGEKIDGVWQFDEEDLEKFLNDPNVHQGLKSKQKMQVFDFLLEDKKTEDKICFILDVKADRVKADETAKLFCAQMNQPDASDAQFTYEWMDGAIRIILTGPEKVVMQMLNRYYGSKS